MAAIQRELLAAALRLVRPGGRIVYSVCTFFAEETLEVTAGHGAAPPAELPGVVWEHGRLLGPHLTATDGMFITVIGG
jgi:16S rRNA (cytosine967-C5)-methyltransferase